MAGNLSWRDGSRNQPVPSTDSQPSFSHVSAIWDVRPSLLEQVAAECICLAESNRSESLGFKGEAESSDTAEQVKMGKFIFHKTNPLL